MTEHYSFFDAVQDSNGNYDREYNAQQFTDYFGSLITTGVMKGAFNQLEVSVNGANMTSIVKSGVAFVETKRYFNDSLLELTHDTEVVGLSRIDRIVIRLDLSTENRYVRAFIKKGTPNANPVAPALTRTSTVYEISLAQVKIVGGQTYINTTNVTDERGNKDVCPWAGSKILPNFDNETLEQLVQEVENLSVLEKPILATLNTGWGHRLTTSFAQPLSYYKDPFGIVHVEGILQNNSATSTLITTLPLAYRPKNKVTSSFIAESESGNKNVDLIEVETNGNIKIPTTTKYAYIDISFRIDLEGQWWL